MSEHPRRRYAPHAHSWHPRHIGEDALHFGKWFVSNKFALMEGFLGELRDDPTERDPRDIEDRFLRATKHAKRVLVARGVVTVLLALGVVATAGASLAESVWVPTLFASDVAAAVVLLARVATIAGASSVVLFLARLAFDRYLELVETTATFLAIELAACSSAALSGRRA